MSDTVELTPTSTGVVTVAVRAGNFEGSVDVRAVTSPDEIVSLWGESLQVTVGKSRQVCFAARAGEDYVLGATWAYGATPRVTVVEEPELTEGAVGAVAAHGARLNVIAVDLQEARREVGEGQWNGQHGDRGRLPGVLEQPR